MSSQHLDCMIIKIYKSRYKFVYNMLMFRYFNYFRLAVKNSVIDLFAGPPDTGLYSPSVQKTLYDIQKLALGKIPQVY